MTNLITLYESREDVYEDSRYLAQRKHTLR
jgi:hypothetical protein